MNDTEQKIPDATADEDREILTFVMTNMYLKPQNASAQDHGADSGAGCKDEAKSTEVISGCSGLGLCRVL